MNCAEYMDYYVACEISGYIAAPVNFRLAAPEVAFMLNDATPRVLIFEAQYIDLLERIRHEAPSIETWICLPDAERAAPEWAVDYETFLAAGDVGGVPWSPEPGDFVRLVYTSGTTGRPKGAVKTQRAELLAARKIAESMDMTGATSILLMMPMFHVGAQLEQIGQSFVGGLVVLQRGFDTRAVLETIERERIEIVHMAPTMIQQLLTEQDVTAWDLSSLHTVCYAAAPMPVRVLEDAVSKMGLIFCDMYGSTEIGPTTMLYKHLHVLGGTEAETRRLASVGQSMPDVALRILDGQGRDCPPGVPGEVFIRSTSMFSGYWNNSAATVEAIREGWYASGDVGYLDERDYLFLVDRTKDMIITGGENVYCREVEEALMAHPAVHDVAVIGTPDDRWGESVFAVVIPVPGAARDDADLIAFCKDRIARYKAPKAVAWVEELPRLPSGKVSKVKLRETYARG